MKARASKSRLNACRMTAGITDGRHRADCSRGSMLTSRPASVLLGYRRAGFKPARWSARSQH